MKMIPVALCHIFFLLFSSNLCADAKSDKTTLLKLLTFTKTYSAEFTQQGSDNLSERQSGRIYLKKPALFLIEIKKPSLQKIISNGHSVWVYDEDLWQATQYKKSKYLQDSPIGLISQNPELLLKSYQVSKNKAATGVQFSLTAHKPEALFPKLTLYFDSHKALIQMRAMNHLGQIVNMTFSKIKLNSPIKTKQFDFMPPKGVDVITTS